MRQRSSESGDRQSGLPRVGASSYLNTAPLIWSFSNGAHAGTVELITDAAPARCADMLARGTVEAALVPVIEYQRLPEVCIVSNACVGARREVRSVVLATRRDDLSDVRTVALDESSRTSAALVQIIFREFLGRELQTAPARPDVQAMLAAHDAALIIGDPAMTFAREGLRVYDLARLWHEHTGTGFVFALWMAHEHAAKAVGAIDFAAARDEGLAHADEIVKAYETELQLPRAELLSYLRDNLCFELNAEMRAGLELYFRLAHKHGLAPEARPLRWLK
jgi:chorismate dehydratase